jgi:phospholipase/carboxylesterase
MADLASRTGKMAGFVASQKARLGASRVIGMGYSNGANILAAVAFHAPGLFDDLVLMHPLIPFRPAPAALGGTRALITAGERDPICPTPLTEALAGCLREDGAEVLVHWHPGGHEIRPQEFEAASAFLRAAPAAASLAGRPVSGFARGPGGT